MRLSEQNHHNLIATCLMSRQDFMIYCNDRIEWRVEGNEFYINDLSKDKYALKLENNIIIVYKIVRHGFLYLKKRNEIVAHIVFNTTRHIKSVFDFLEEYLIKMDDHPCTMKLATDELHKPTRR